MSAEGQKSPRKRNLFDEIIPTYIPYFTNSTEPSLIELVRIVPNTSRRSGVVVEIEASTVSFTDCMIRRNLFSAFDFATFPVTSGVDCVGRISYCGDLAQRRGNLKVGDRVCCLYPLLGGNARYASLPAEYLHRVPDSVHPGEAVCLVRSYLAAIQILYRSGGMDKKVKKNHRVLVTGSNGNIGRAVVELSKRAGAAVYASCKIEHREFMLDVIGADEWLNEDPTTWRDNLSVDIIIDCVCFTGNPKYLLRFLGRNGVKLVNVGNSRGLKRKMLKQMQHAGELYDIDEFLAEEPSTTFCGIQFMPKVIKKEDIYKQDSGSLFPKIGTAMHAVTPLPFRSNIYDYNLFESIEQRQDLMADDLSLLFNLLESGIIRPAIALEVGLHEIQQAQELVEAGGLQGAVICRP